MEKKETNSECVDFINNVMKKDNVTAAKNLLKILEKKAKERITKILNK